MCVNKSAIAVVLAVIIAAGGAGYYLMQNLDVLVKELIEQAGTDATGTRVQVQDVELNLAQGGATISGLTIANPEGFSAESLFTMGNITVDIDPASLSETVYVIERISVDGARVLAEQVGGGTNLQALLNNMEGAGAQSSTDASGSADVRLAVESLNFSNGSVSLRSDVFGEREFALPNITMANLGSRENGLTPDELGAEIADRLVGEVTDAVTDEIKDLAREAAKAKLKEQLGEKTAEGLNKLKGLFGRSKDEEAAADPSP